MLKLEEIKRYYPEHLKAFDRFIIREYLQYKILEIIFESPYAHKLSFLGGTALRIIHNSQRFSEDLDFDNFNLDTDDFKGITLVIKKALEQLGYTVEMRNVEKGAYHCYIQFPVLLYNEGLSNHKEEKILIQLDTEAHHFEYEPDKPLLNKFDVFTQVFSTPVDILLAQKFYAVLNRKRNKGRDFFDIVHLLGQNLRPNYPYLIAKVNIDNPKDLKQSIIDKCNALNMQEMANDVRPFLFNPKDDKKVLMFVDYVKQVNL